MVRRWLCCKCGNSWMVVRESNVCTYSECQHEKCNGCTTVMMDVRRDPDVGDNLPPITATFSPCGGGGSCVSDEESDDDNDNDNDFETERRPSIRPPGRPIRSAHDGYEANDDFNGAQPHLGGNGVRLPAME